MRFSELFLHPARGSLRIAVHGTAHCAWVSRARTRVGNRSKEELEGIHYKYFASSRPYTEYVGTSLARAVRVAASCTCVRTRARADAPAMKEQINITGFTIEAVDYTECLVKISICWLLER